MTTTDSRIRLFDRTGAPLVEILAKVTRSWELNGWGEASFKFPYTDKKWCEKHFQFGNHLLIETNNLPDWGGVIDGPRDWGAYEATINAKSGEYLYAMRALMSAYTATDEPGGHYKALINLANIDEDTLIDAGNITGAGAAFAFPVAYIPIIDAVEDLCEKSGFDYSVTPLVNINGNLTFRGNLYKKRVVYRRTILREGWNLKTGNRSLSEYPPKANDILAYGNSGKDASRVKYRQESSISQRKYRLYQRCIAVSSNTQADVREAVITALELDSQKQNIFSDLIALNKAQTFDELTIGGVHDIVFVKYGFGLETKARIVHMEYTDGLDEVKLTAEEYEE